MDEIKEGDLVEVPYGFWNQLSNIPNPTGRVKIILGKYCTVLIRLPKERKEHIRYYELEDLIKLGGSDD